MPCYCALYLLACLHTCLLELYEGKLRDINIHQYVSCDVTGGLTKEDKGRLVQGT